MHMRMFAATAVVLGAIERGWISDRVVFFAIRTAAVVMWIVFVRCGVR